MLFRSRQQAKQIQEIRNAYEQQHRKLSEFADFVRRYFPYVEKLMPIINFLRDRLKFNDGIIRRLCEFKAVSYTHLADWTCFFSFIGSADWDKGLPHR